MRTMLLCALLLAVASRVDAAGTQRARETAREFLAGEMDGVILDASGRLVPAPVRPREFSTDAFFVWSLAEVDGRIVAGTGDGGVLLLQDGDVLQPLARTLSLEILCLLPWDDGVLAGSSPDGVVYYVDRDGTVEVAVDVPQQSIWDLELGSKAGHWLAATGPGARVIRVGPDAPAGEVLLDLPATNTTGLWRDAGGLWISTQGPGLLFRVAGDDAEAARLVYEAEEDEIRGLVGDGDGGVIVLSVAPDGTANDEERKGNGKGKGNGAAPVRSRITWHPRDGGVETVYAGEETLLSLLRRPDGDLLVGEAETGRVIRIDRSGRRSLWLDLDEGDPIVLATRRDGTVLVGTGNLGRVFELRGSSQEGGTYTSAVLSVPHNQRWGRVWADGETDAVTVSTRSGVRVEPDDTWSGWSDPQKLGERVTSPVAPYLQVRLHLEKRATVTEFTVAYRERNLPPRLKLVRVEPAGGELQGGRLAGSPQQVSQRFDDGLGVEFSIQQERRPTEPETTTWARGLRSIAWQAEDPNGDRLHYRVEVRRLPDGEWRTLVEDYPDRAWAWDTRSVADGRYRIRVSADDAYDNAAATARGGSAESHVVHVDNTAPRVRRTGLDDEEATVEAEDSGSPLVSVAMRGDDSPWRPLDPVDGVLDGSRESFRLPLGADPVWVRAVDAAGNTRVEEIRR